MKASIRGSSARRAFDVALHFESRRMRQKSDALHLKVSFSIRLEQCDNTGLETHLPLTVVPEHMSLTQRPQSVTGCTGIAQASGR